MIQTIKGFLKRSSSPQYHEPEPDHVLEELRALDTRLNELTEKAADSLEELRTEQASLFDEMVQHMHASQQEIIDNLTVQLQAAEVLRLEQTEQIDTLTRELSATREQLAELIELQKQRPE